MEKKAAYFDKLIKLVGEYPSILVVRCENVGSNHMQKIRKSLRGDAVLLMGKNTMMRKAIRGHLKKVPQLEALLPYLKFNIGLVFTKGDLSAIRGKLLELKVAAPAKAGTLAPQDVIVPAGNTGMEPTKTSFLQALNIPSKINKGQVEITNDVHLIKKGDKVGTSEATLLQMLNIKPFFYGLQVETVYDNGNVYGAEILDLTADVILQKFANGLGRLASASLGLSYPTLAAFPHVVMNGYKNLIAVALATNYSFKQVQKLKDMLANPDAFKPQSTAAPAKTEEKKDDKKGKKEEKEEKKEDEDEDMGGGMGGLFGDD